MPPPCSPPPVAGEGPSGQIAAYSGLRLGSVTFCASLLGQSAALAALRCPKKSSRCSLARFFRPLRVLRLAASATGGARLRTPCPLPRIGEGGLYPQSLHKNAPAAPYKRRRVGRNLRLSRADPALCSGQPSPLLFCKPYWVSFGPRRRGAFLRGKGCKRPF